MVRVQCPYCQRRYRTEIGAFGRTAVCTRCSQSFKIGESRPPFQWKHTELAEDSWIGVPPPEEKQEMKHCIICDAPLRPEMVRCPECGANQITGVVHRHRPRHEGEDEASFWSVIPARMILIALAVALVAGGIYWGAKSIGRKTVQFGDELADSALVARISRQLREGQDERELADKYAGYVKDGNLPRFVGLLSAQDRYLQQAAILLIGSSQATNLEPLVTAPNAAQGSGPVRSALAAIGPRRLIRLSCDEDAAVRKSAADGLSLLFNLKRDDSRVMKLSQLMTPSEKHRLLNDLCRPYPLLAGTFAVVINDTPSLFTVQVEQVGRMFYLKVDENEFASSPDTFVFTIPIHRWCAATGSAVDPVSVQELLGGEVRIASSHGASWEGQVKLTGKRRIAGDLPGFLPFEPPAPGQHIEAALHLDSPPQ